jgi:hypothetical protein
MPGGWVALSRPLAARTAWRNLPDMVEITPEESALLTLTIWSRAEDEKYNVFDCRDFLTINSDGSWPVETL